MSTQRRRVLEGSKKLEIPADGVYIEGLDGKAYTVDEWQSGNSANSVVVANGDIKFRVALTDAPSLMKISQNSYDPLENYMAAISDNMAARADYDGAGNTAKILQMQPSTEYAAGYCNAYIFPDGKTKGFLPSLGQLHLVYQNYNAVNNALYKCGGTLMGNFTYNFHHWSSTFWGFDEQCRSCWARNFYDGAIDAYCLYDLNYVRPFADIS